MRKLGQARQLFSRKYLLATQIFHKNRTRKQAAMSCENSEYGSEVPDEAKTTDIIWRRKVRN
jgi:hypothetical protein